MNPKKRKAIKKNIRSKPKKQMSRTSMIEKIVNKPAECVINQGQVFYGITGGGMSYLSKSQISESILESTANGKQILVIDPKNELTETTGR